MVAGEENFCRGKMRENLYCGRIRLFRWNEKLFKNKVSNSEGLALFKMNSTFRSIVEPQFDEIGNQSPVEIVRNTIVVPFDLSELLAKKRYFGLQVVRNSRQFLSKINEILGQQICDYLFTRFQIDPITILKPNCPKLVIVVEVARSRRIIFNNIKDCNVSKSSYLPPLTIPPEWVSKREIRRQECPLQGTNREVLWKFRPLNLKSLQRSSIKKWKLAPFVNMALLMWMIRKFALLFAFTSSTGLVSEAGCWKTIIAAQPAD
ncbi:hypothetical protein ACH5RR_003608 [Cinchona calisaya]|uniref:Uncharacterized protein n=1 Tax=Cinchona calisaya TaxID=153742 RepID=A0ABD3AV81_9GENT